MKNRHKSPVEELEHGTRNLAEAVFCFHNDMVDVGARMLYYSLFHFEKALIQTRGAYTKSHKQTHIQFRKLFLKTGDFGASVNELISELEDAREEADYGHGLELSPEEITSYLAEVRAFGERCRLIVAEHEADHESQPPA